ncbi:MAG: mechanosensitive ion channel [Cruoricaptor ignavus]|nr:mechanosensitive ion channel [Cruoricaptor ignavus]
MDLNELNALSLKNFSIEWWIDKATTFGSKLITAILIIVIGFWITTRIARVIRKSLGRTHLSVAIKKVLSDVISILLKFLVILVAMNTAGIEITSLVALMGGLAVGIGMALQGSLANFAGGILILTFKPYSIGDTIETMDKIGTVQDITLLQTILLTADLKTVILPNGSVFNNPIINYSKNGIRRVEIVIGIGYDDDFDKAKEVLMEVLKNEPLILHDRDCVLEINEFGDNSVNLAMYAFAETQNFLKAKWSLNRAVKIALDKNGFNIPYPQRDIHIITK